MYSSSSPRPGFYRLIAVAFLSVPLIFITALLSRCHKEAKVDPGFSRYISSYTTGVISKTSAIRIQLANEVSTSHAQNEELKDDVFDFSPSIKGKAYWVDAQTIEFRPAAQLDPGKNYHVDFHLGGITKVAGEFEHFTFAFEIIRPDFTIAVDGLASATPTSLDKMKLTGSVQTADFEDDGVVEKLITATYSSPVKVTWEHHPATKTHNFTVNDLPRDARKSTEISLNWDGDALSVDKKGSEHLDVPAIGVFKVLAISAVQEQDQYVLARFSNPVKIGQELNGLTGLSKIADAAYTIDGSTVKIYAPERLDGSYLAFVNEGVEDITGKKIGKAFTANLFFENRLPAVTIPGKGVILPGDGKLVMPFEAVNLNAVDVSIIRIYENNVPQYFQSNTFDGEEQLRQVGKPVVQTTIRLNTDPSLNLGKKNRFTLDVDRLMRAEPGAIYRVVIGFRKSYSLYNCGGTKADTTKSVTGDDEDEGQDHTSVDEDDDFWQRYDNYYPPGFNWNERDDPCSLSYYNREHWATRNIIASNIGLITKRGNDNSMLVAVTNILDAKPMSGVELELQDYQQQVILKTTSDGDGFARFTLKRRPYLLIARKGAERGYLKLDDGSALPLARFDVGGDAVQNGLKGFMYAERGVWRPGDSIFLSFILEDKEKKFPPDHPVEFELHTPTGQLYKRMISTSPGDGFYSFHTATSTSSPTGNWQARVKAGGAVYEKTIKIETIMPNRMKLDLSFGTQTTLTKGSSTAGVLTAHWLFGGAAQNLKAKVDAFLSAQTTAFNGFENYTFDDPTLPFNTQTQTVFNGSLDASGSARVAANMNVEGQAPGQLRANFLVKVVEPGGNFSIQQVALPYNVYTGYTGLKIPPGSGENHVLFTGKDHVIDLAAVNANGQLQPGVRNVEIELYKIQWRWWWDQSGDELSNFTQNEYNKLVVTSAARLTNGRGKWVLRIPNEGWGRYLLKVKDPQTGHSTGKIIYLDWPNWAERLQQDNPTEAAMLSFTSDKRKYKVGDQATLTIPTGGEGRALISIENGSKVLKSVWIDTEKGRTSYKFEVDKTMTPNVFVTVTLLQQHAQTVNDLPIRMYGSIPLIVDDPATVLRPVIGIPATIRPDSRTAITVSEAAGKEMTYTIALVDEGILDLTNFKTPDPHGTFYAREALGVKTWDLFDFVMGAFGGGLERILSIGGDQTLGNAKNATVNRFKPAVKFLGPFHLDAGGKKTTYFTLPQYIGSVRAMVIAGHDGSYGAAEKAVTVKKPLMLLATLPRVLGPGEKFQLPVSVFATENTMKTVTVKIESTAFDTPGGLTKTISFPKPGDQLVTFDLGVKQLTGVGKVKITASSGKETATEEISLAIRNPNPPVTRVEEKELHPGESWTSSWQPAGMAGTNTATIEISSVPALNLAERLKYLVEYPHGCVEQTTSSAFPQLYLDQLIDLSSRQKAETTRNIRSAINKLNGFQVSSGGLSYWPGDSEADEWGTNYAGHFMLSAEAKGYTLPAGFMDNWKKYQHQKAVNWVPNFKIVQSDLVQAYRLYLLALARAPELGAMNRLKEISGLSVSARWRLAAAYQLAGQSEIGSQMIRGLPLTVKPYRQLRDTYGSDLRDEAMILETLTLLGKQQQAAVSLRMVTAALAQDEWYSTQTTAYALLAVAQYCGSNRQGSKLDFSFKAGTAGIEVASPSYFWQKVLNGERGTTTVKNKGKNVLYVRLIRQGQPAPGQELNAPNTPNTLQMKVAYFTLKGREVDAANLKQGTDFVAQVKIRNPGGRGRYENMALTEVFPSGWEILNTRMLNNDEVFKSSPADYRDVRDDRVNTYFSLGAGQEVTYYVMLNAAYTGRFYLPAASCTAMYDASINALQKGQWVTVTK